jgi:hypothetical protein
MNNLSKHSFHTGNRPRDMTIDWEFLPSLSHLIDRKEAAQQDLPVWAETMPATFDALQQQSDPFHETLDGLAIREVNEPEIFKAFFGTPDRPADAR